MGIHGPKVETLKLTKKGYVRRYYARFKKCRMEHVVVWEDINGPVPKGFDIHHINEIKHDNRIENLKLLSKLEHKRLHSGCYIEEGKWKKPCKTCNIAKDVGTEYYERTDGLCSYCKECWIKRVVKEKSARKARRKKL